MVSLKWAILFFEWGGSTIQACIKELLIPELLGKNATDRGNLATSMENWFLDSRMGITVPAQSAIDIALWDALGKQVNMPLHRIWGHCNDTIPAYGSGCWRGYGPDGMVEASVMLKKASKP